MDGYPFTFVVAFDSQTGYTSGLPLKDPENPRKTGTSVTEVSVLVRAVLFGHRPTPQLVSRAKATIMLTWRNASTGSSVRCCECNIGSRETSIVMKTGKW